ncbi:hypothetical protein [Megamonas hypermegale]|uniref:hypothetical protein n=1 Tax=Megamonas hypermegale TaxID=158847 RepID=UPI0026F10D30|nr:hypothetical protein [Megamonas hypermegale]
MLELAPIIHSRTYHCDFVSKFMVKPEDFTENDIEWAMKKILASTSSIDTLEGERLIILKKDNINIAGITCFIQYLAEKCSSKDIAESLKKYYYDERNRLMYAFIGFNIKNLSSISKIQLNYDLLAKCFIKQIEGIWNSSFVESANSKYEKYFQRETLQLSDEDIKKIKNDKAYNIIVYDSNDETNRIVFNYYLNKSTADNMTFCSNIDDLRKIKEKDFSIITTRKLDNIVQKLKTLETEEKKETTFSTNLPSENRCISEKKTISGPKSNIGKIIVGSVIILIIIMVLMMK